MENQYETEHLKVKKETLQPNLLAKMWKIWGQEVKGFIFHVVDRGFINTGPKLKIFVAAQVSSTDISFS